MVKPPKTKAKPKKEHQHAEAPQSPKPTIPNEILKAFLDEKIATEDLPNITQVRDGFVWEKGGIERYRINAWMKRDVEGQYCHDNYIGYSWFVHYDLQTKTITDKTTGLVKEHNKKESKKLNGIANGDERIGKSFR